MSAIKDILKSAGLIQEQKERPKHDFSQNGNVENAFTKPVRAKSVNSFAGGL